MVETLKKNGSSVARVEGSKTAEWILLDYGDFVVHVFAPETRVFYGLEGLWGNAERIERWRMKVAEWERDGVQ